MDNVDNFVDILKTDVDNRKRHSAVCISLFLLFTGQKTREYKDFLSNGEDYKQDIRKLSTNCQQLVDKVT